MSNRKIINAAATGGIGYYPVGNPTDAYYDNVSLLLNGDVEVDSNFANVSLLLDGNTIADKSNNKAAVTAYGNAAVTSVNKKFGTGSYYFDGSGDYIRPAASDNYMFGTGDFTVEFWVYRISGGEFFGNGPAGFGSFGIGLGATTGDTTKLQCGIYGYPAANVSCANNFPSNQWVYVAITRASGTTRIFVNGIKDGENVNGGANNTTNTASIGEVWVGSGSALNGYIDDFRITKGVARYTSSFTPPVKAFPTHEILDSSVYRLPVTAYGNARIDTTTKKFGTGAMYFDGTGDYLTIPVSSNTAINGTENFTVEAWLYPTAATTYHCFYSGQWSIQLYMTSERRIEVYFSSSATGGSYIATHTSTGTLTLNQWTHVAVTRTGNDYIIFLNGVVDSTYVSAGGSIGVHTSTSVGSFNSASYLFIGYIDDFRITKGYARYTTNFTPPSASLPTIPPTIPADPWWGNVSLLLDGNTTDAYDPYWQNVSLMLTGDDFIDWSNNHLAISNTNITLSSTIKKYGTSSLAFNGVSGNALSITNPGTTATIGTGDFTIEAWAYYLDITSWRDIICFVGSPSWGITTNNGDLGAYNIGINSSGTIVPINQWFHVAVARQSGTVRLFLNGSLVTSAVNTTSLTATQINIGSWSTTNSENLNGYIAELRVTKGVARYTANFTPPIAALPAYKIQDRTQNALTVTPYGNVQLSTDVMKNGTGSMFFDGVGDNVSIANTPYLTLDTTDFTIECWFNQQATLPYAHLFTSTVSYGTTNNIRTTLNTSAFNVLTGNAALLSNVGSFVNGKWVHFALVRTGTTLTLYQNGISVGTATTSVSFVMDTFMVGGEGTYPFNGYIDDFRITKGYARYTQNFTPPSQSFATQYISTGYDANYADVSLLLNGTGTNGSTTFTDLSSSPKTVTVGGNAQVSTAVKKYGVGSMYFDGGNTRLNVTTHANLNLTDDFTIEFWMYPLAAVSAYPVLITTGDGSVSLETSIIYNYPNSGINFSVADGKSITGSAPSNNNWHHIVVSRQGTTTRMFIDGVKVGTDITTAYTFTQSKNWYIGDRQANAGGGNYPFKGYIDDLRITKGIARYTTNFTPPTYQLPTDTTGTVIDPLRSSTSLLLRGNGTNGSTSFTDESPNGLTVTNNGSVTVNTTTKKYGTGSMYSDGTNYLTIPSSPNLAFGTGDFTVEFWYYSSNVTYSSYPVIYGNSNSGAWATNTFVILSSHLTVSGAFRKFMLEVYNMNNAGNILTSTTTVNDNTWYHVAVTRQGSAFRLFVNGIIESTYTSSASVDSGTSSTAAVCGTSDANNRSPCYIDDLRITKGYARYTANFTPPTYEDPIVTGTVYDYNYPQVSLLLNGDGTNGSTVFKDLSSSPKAITAYGNAQISTAVKKYGTGAMYFDGTSGYLSIPNSSAFDLSSNTFTIEAWVYQTSNSGNAIYSYVVDKRGGGGTWGLLLNSGIPSLMYGSGMVEALGTTAIPLNTWTHIAASVSSGTLRMFINGVQTYTTNGLTFPVGTAPVWIGRPNSYGYYFAGNIDDLRITKDVARYTTNFTPPTAPLPTSYS